MVTETKVKYDGSWRTITQPYVKWSGSWRTIKTIEVKVGGGWELVWEGGPTVSMTGVLMNNYRGFGVAIANLKVDSDGDVYESDETGSYGAASETWLVSGLNTEVWVERSITSGTLSTDDIGTGRPSCSSDIEIGVQTSSGFKTCIGTLSFYDAASGGTLLDTATFNLTADRDGGGGP